MKKYLFTFKFELMTNLQYIKSLLFSFIVYFMMLFIFINLWKYIYSDPNEIINGYTLNQMIWYVIAAEVLWGTLSGRKLCREISDDVKNGNIAYNINKPYNYILYRLSLHLGKCFVKFLIWSTLSMLTGYIFLHSFPDLNILSILAVLLSAFLALVISTLLITFIGLFSFIIEDSGPFYWVYSKLILVLGTIFPIEYFPLWAQSILKYSPIFVVSYGPSRLFVNFSWLMFTKVVIAQLLYVILAYLLCLLIYKKGVKKLNVNGG